MKRSFTPTQDLEIAAQYTGRGCIGALAALHGVTKTTIRMSLLRAGVNICREKLSLEQKAIAVSRYLAGNGSHEIAACLGVTHPTITKALREAKVTLRDASQAARLRSIDVTAFRTITPESAYWIGFMMADGSVSRGGNVCLGLTIADRGHLETFRLFLKSSHPIGQRKVRPMTHLKKSKVYIPKPFCVLSITCKPLAESLRRYGLHADKSNGASIIGLEFDRDFWRGVIDGDGSVYISKPRHHSHARPILALVGSKTLLRQFADFVLAHIPNATATVRGAGGRLRQVVLHGQTAIEIIRRLYDGAIVALPRKAQAAEQIMRQFG